MFQETLQRINDEQSAQDREVGKVKKEQRRKLITTALGYNPWEVK